MQYNKMPSDQTAFDTVRFFKCRITSTALDSFQVDGSVLIGGNLTVTGTISGGTITYSTTNTGTLNVTNATGTTFTVASTQQSTSVGTGSIVCQGGASIAGNLYVGGTLVAGSVTYATTTTGSMTITTGSGTTLVVASTTDSTTTTDGAATIAGGLGVVKRINSGSLRVFDTTASTSSTTGAIICNGGLGVQGASFIGGILNITNSTASTSKTTGCALFTGGIGVGGKVWCDSLDMTNNLSVGGNNITLGGFNALTITSNQLVLNSGNNYTRVIVGPELQVNGSISATNMGTVINTSLTLLTATTFYETPYLNASVERSGLNYNFVVHYKFKLGTGVQRTFTTYFESLLTLLNPLNRVVMGTGYVSGFNAPALESGSYNVNSETRFMYPLAGMIEMKQKAPPTTSGAPDPSQGYQYIIRAYNADPLIQLPTTLPSSVELEYDANTSPTSTGPFTVFEVVMNFKIPVQ